MAAQPDSQPNQRETPRTQVTSALGGTGMTISPLRTGILMAVVVFTFFTIAINSQHHGWFAWYHLSQLGQKTQAVVTRRQPEIHQTCFFKYTVGSREYEGSDQGCGSQVGRTVLVTYLPADPSFATIASPTEQFAFLVVTPFLMSALAGAVGAWRSKARLARRPHEHSDTSKRR